MGKFILSYRRQFLGIWRGKLWRAHLRSGGLGLVLGWSIMAMWGAERVKGPTLREKRSGLCLYWLYSFCTVVTCVWVLWGSGKDISLWLYPKQWLVNQGSEHALLLLGHSKESQCIFPCLALLRSLWWFKQQQETLPSAIAHPFAVTGEPLMSPVSPVLFLWVNLALSSQALSLLSLWPENVLADGWMSWEPSRFDACCLALGHYNSPPGLAFLAEWSATARCPANTPEKQEMLLCKVFIPG